MKRDTIALVVQPYKNVLVPRADLKISLDNFVTATCDLAAKHPSLRFNVVFSGLHLELIDPILIIKLRDLTKNGQLEFLSPGYTEIFASFCSRGIFAENLALGQSIFAEKLGFKPTGYAAPFSNWEPSYLDIIVAAGFSYSVISRSLITRHSRLACGYWSTEHAGAPLYVIPQVVIPADNVPEDLSESLTKAITDDTFTTDANIPKLLCINYLTPLLSEKETPFAWLTTSATALELNALAYQTICISEYFGMAPPLALHYIPPSLFIRREEIRTIPYFRNYLHTFDQIGIMQRKMIELSEQCEQLPDSAKKSAYKKQLCLLYDINRFLPQADRGFCEPLHRHTSFSEMITFEAALYFAASHQGGHIRIADFMRNGTKCIIMENRACKAYLDYKNGGQLFAFDYRPRSVNLGACYSGIRHEQPAITAAGISKTLFIDHILDQQTTHSEFASDPTLVERGDYVNGQFSYTVKKSPEGVKMLLVRNGSYLSGDKAIPLSMEKVFGLDGDSASLSFAYKLTTHSLMPLSFLLAIELNFFIPGALYNKAFFSLGRKARTDLTNACIQSPSCTKFSLEDHAFGLNVAILTQKPVSVWCYPVHCGKDATYQGTTLVMTIPVNIDANTPFSFPGKIRIRKTRRIEKMPDAI